MNTLYIQILFLVAWNVLVQLQRYWLFNVNALIWINKWEELGSKSFSKDPNLSLSLCVFMCMCKAC